MTRPDGAFADPALISDETAFALPPPAQPSWLADLGLAAAAIAAGVTVFLTWNGSLFG